MADKQVPAGLAQAEWHGAMLAEGGPSAEEMEEDVHVLVALLRPSGLMPCSLRGGRLVAEQ